MRAWVLLSAAVVSMGGCAEPAAVHLLIDTTASMPSDLNGFEVTISSSSPEGRVCESVSALIYVAGQAELPAFVSAERGSIYTTNLMYGVVGFQRSDPWGIEVRSAPHIGWVEWPDSGVREVEVTLDRRCLSLVAGEGEHCAEGRIEPIEVPEEFGDPANIDRDVLCLLPE